MLNSPGSDATSAVARRPIRRAPRPPRLSSSEHPSRSQHQSSLRTKSRATSGLPLALQPDGVARGRCTRKSRTHLHASRGIANGSWFRRLPRLCCRAALFRLGGAVEVRGVTQKLASGPRLPRRRSSTDRLAQPFTRDSRVALACGTPARGRRARRRDRAEGLASRRGGR